MPHEFFIVDVFAERKYAGNQLAVVIGAGDLDGGEMQAVAAEFDYSETTFVTGGPTESGWPVRIFTPEAEVPFAGHPTLGTAAVIRRELADAPGGTVTLDLAAGEIPVTVRKTAGEEVLWMDQNEPTFGATLPPERAAEILGLDLEAIDDRGPVQVVSTGLPALVVPLVDRAALTAIDLDREAYDGLVAEEGVELVHAACTEPRSEANDLAVRMFAPGLGVSEDPATGSANGCLAGYLSRHAFLGDASVAVRVEQGYEMGRPSLLFLEATPRGAGIDVAVGGSVVPVATGRLY
ncbi:MAG: PhzF family phenazine biosynthesis protein [Halovenus sp.]